MAAFIFAAITSTRVLAWPSKRAIARRKKRTAAVFRHFYSTRSLLVPPTVRSFAALRPWPAALSRPKHLFFFVVMHSSSRGAQVEARLGFCVPPLRLRLKTRAFLFMMMSILRPSSPRRRNRTQTGCEIWRRTSRWALAPLGRCDHGSVSPKNKKRREEHTNEPRHPPSDVAFCDLISVCRATRTHATDNCKFRLSVGFVWGRDGRTRPAGR